MFRYATLHLLNFGIMNFQFSRWNWETIKINRENRKWLCISILVGYGCLCDGWIRKNKFRDFSSPIEVGRN